MIPSNQIHEVSLHLNRIAKRKKKSLMTETYLVVLWLRLRAPKARDPGLIPGEETKYHMLQ